MSKSSSVLSLQLHTQNEIRFQCSLRDDHAHAPERAFVHAISGLRTVYVRRTRGIV